MNKAPMNRAPMTRPPKIPRPEESQPAKMVWFDRKKYVHVNVWVQKPKEVRVDIQREKIILCCKNDQDEIIYNELNLYDKLMIGDSRERVYDRTINFLLRKLKPDVAWPRLQKDESRPSWIQTDFDNWRDWENEEEDGKEEFEGYMDAMEDVGGKAGPKPSMDDFFDSD